MAVAQSTYSTTLPIGLVGQIANGETSNRISRTIESSAGVAFGQPVFRGSNDHGCVIGGTFAATGAGSAAASGNVGTGTITASPAITAGAKAGRYTIVLIATSATAPYLVYDPDGLLVGDGVVASANTSIPGITTFTISNAGTMTAGDTYYIDVTYTANVNFLGLSILSHSLQILAGATADVYPQYETVPIMTEGVMWVTAGATVADGDDVYWNPATSRFTNTTTHIRIPNAKFDTDATNGNLVKVALKSRLIA